MTTHQSDTSLEHTADQRRSSIEQSPAEHALMHRDLLAALDHHCCCGYDRSGGLVTPCPGHDALGSATFVVHMEFGRFLAQRLRAEEGLAA
jgi:hypothetical protein